MHKISMKKISQIKVSRLILYRKILNNLKKQAVTNVYSHTLSELSGFSPAQVRRDLMEVGYTGTPAKGYNVENLFISLTNYLEFPEGQGVAIIGLGNLGKAILDYCYGRSPKIFIVAAFDIDPEKVGKIFNETKCYHINDLEKVIINDNIKIAVLAAPPQDAQEIAERLIKSGVNGILNYSPIKLNVPANVYVENRDMMMALQQTAYFSKILEQESVLLK